MKSTKTKYHFFIYSNRFLILYIIYGILSLVIELFMIRILTSFGAWYSVSVSTGFIAGVIFAFIMNAGFNFHIAKSKQKRALFYFAIISLFSFGFQMVIRTQLLKWGISMDMSRFLIAGIFFLISYGFHRRITFKEHKKVGVAIYADGVEDIKQIYEKVSDVCDFIHIDIVDNTFKEDCADIKAYRAEVVRAYWQKKRIDVHIMSKTPSKWFNEILPYVNTVFVHINIKENLDDILKQIQDAGCSSGLAVSLSENLNDIYPYLERINDVLLLAIKNPGYSGQKFEVEILCWIDELDKHKYRNNFRICVDGGVNDTVIKLLNVESVVSGNYVLSSPNPIKKIMYLQTSGQYDE
jgi:ribulose-phosphate 3-epimerase